MRGMNAMARLLVTDSWWLRAGFAIFVIFAIATFSVGNSAIPMAFAWVGAVSIGYSGWKLRAWEPGHLVPEMSRTCANVMVLMALGIWMAMSVFLLSLHGMSVLYLGIALFWIAVGLWMGFGDQLKLYSIFSVLCVASVIAFSGRGELLYAYWTKLAEGLPASVVAAIGACIFMFSFFSVWSFHRFASSFSHGAKENRMGNVSGWFFDKELLGDLAESSELVRLQKATHVTGVLTPFDVSILMVAGGTILGLLWWTRGIEDVVVPLRWICSMSLVFIPTAIFHCAYPKSFERLWMWGIMESRVQTGRKLISIVLRSTAVLVSFIVICLAVQSPLDLETMVGSLSVLLLALGGAAIVLWMSIRFFEWLKPRVGIMFVLVSVFSTISSVIVMDVVSKSPINIVEILGPATAIGLSLLVAIGGWAFCLFDGANCIARHTLDSSEPLWPID